MKNTCEVHSDNICVYATLSIQPSAIGRVMLTIINLFPWAIYIYVAAQIPGEEVGQYALPLIIVPLFLVFTIGRYSAWNLWGKEFITINTKAITYSRSYGVILTKEKVIEIKNTLSLQYERLTKLKGIEYGRLHFFDYDENNNPIEIFETTIMIPKEDNQEIIEHIHHVYLIEQEEENRKHFTASLN
jgi:hypothetical protein